MNYITMSQYGTVYGWGACNPESVEHLDPGPGRQVVLNMTPPPRLDTFFRYVGGALVDTNQPKLPPQPGLTWDDQSATWVDVRDLSQLKAAKWEAIKAARTEAEYGGFIWDSSTFDSDAASQQRIIGASQLATLTPGFEIDWTLADNTVRTLSGSDMNAVGVALGVHVNAQYVHARDLRQQIEDATTPEAVAAIAW